MEHADISILKGKILKDIRVDYGRNEITFIDKNNTSYLMAHKQEGSEDMFLEGTYEYGDINDLLNTPITIADEIEDFDKLPLNEDNLGYSWKLYQVGTEDSCILIRWYGEYNGFYI